MPPPRSAGTTPTFLKNIQDPHCDESGKGPADDKFYYQKIFCGETCAQIRVLETKLNYINAFDKALRSDKLTAALIRLVGSTFGIFRFTTYLPLDTYTFTCKEENNYLQKLYSTYKVDINETNLLKVDNKKAVDPGRCEPAGRGVEESGVGRRVRIHC